jgi:hypothetical protein
MTTPALGRIGLGALLAAAALLGTATPASAATATAEETLDGLKAAVTARIDLRLAALNKDAVTIDNSQALTDAHQSQLSTVVDDAISGLSELRTAVAAETTLAALREDATSMVNDYRVYALVGPQVRLTVAGDYADQAVARANEAYESLTEEVAEKKAAGVDTTTAEADLARMRSAIDAAVAHLDGVVATLLAIEPGPDTTAIRAGVSTARSAIGSARADLLTAATAGRAVLAFLRAN